MSAHSISVVIPTLNAGKEIGHLLCALASQTIRPDEVLVVDSSSVDDTVAIAESCGARTHVIPRGEFDHGGTRHLAFELAVGDIVCFMTQDAVPANESYIYYLTKPLDDPAIPMVSGRQLPKADARRYEQLVREFNYPATSFVRSKADVESMGIKAFFASDVCSAYRRKEYFEVGGFEHPLKTNEDMLMAATMIEAGYSVAYASDACVFHSHNLTPLQQYERNKLIGEFLEMHKAQLSCASSATGEGIKLLQYVAGRLLDEHRPLELLAFLTDCASRAAGNMRGKADARRARSGERANVFP